MTTHPGWTKVVACPAPTCPPKQYIVPGHHPYCPPPHKVGRVKIDGSIRLSTTYTDHHGHVQRFDIVPGVSYEIDAFSNTRGICHFVGKIVDFETVEGVQEILKAPHCISISAIIIDASDMYESKLLRIRVENIERMLPILGPEHMTPTQQGNVCIEDPFILREIDEFVDLHDVGDPVDGTTTDNTQSSSTGQNGDLGTDLHDYLDP
jgi:hypothetical protein